MSKFKIGQEVFVPRIGGGDELGVIKLFICGIEKTTLEGARCNEGPDGWETLYHTISDSGKKSVYREITLCADENECKLKFVTQSLQSNSNAIEILKRRIERDSADLEIREETRKTLLKLQEELTEAGVKVEDTSDDFELA